MPQKRFHHRKLDLHECEFRCDRHRKLDSGAENVAFSDLTLSGSLRHGQNKEGLSFQRIRAGGHDDKPGPKKVNALKSDARYPVLDQLETL